MTVGILLLLVIIGWFVLSLIVGYLLYKWEWYDGYWESFWIALFYILGFCIVIGIVISLVIFIKEYWNMPL